MVTTLNLRKTSFGAQCTVRYGKLDASFLQRRIYAGVSVESTYQNRVRRGKRNWVGFVPFLADVRNVSFHHKKFRFCSSQF